MEQEQTLWPLIDFGGHFDGFLGLNHLDMTIMLNVFSLIAHLCENL